MPDFWVALDAQAVERIIFPITNGIQVDGVRRSGIRLSDGLQVDFRWIKTGDQTTHADHEVYWGFNDTADHTGEIPTSGWLISQQATSPITYLRARQWGPPPSELTFPMPVAKLFPFIAELPGRDWLNDWKILRNSTERRRSVATAFETGEAPFMFTTFVKFATLAIGSPPTQTQLTNGQTRWTTWINMQVGDRITDPTATIPLWSAMLWPVGSHVMHAGSMHRATFDYALPSEIPGVGGSSSPWELVV